MLALLVLLPAAFNPFGELAVEPLKSSLLRVGAVLVGVCWLISRRRGGCYSDPIAHPIIRAWLILVGVTAVSTALSIEPIVSLFGTFDRGMGWLTLAAGTLLVVCGADLWSDPRRRERAITALLLGAIVPCAYAMLQRLDLDPFIWNTLGAPGSTLGSPTLLGGYLVLLIPLGLYRVVAAARSGAMLQYAFALSLVLLMAAALVQTTIRGALLGVAAGTVTFAMLATSQRRIGIIAAGGFMALAVAVATSATGAAGLQGVGRFLDIARVGDSSIERLTVWRDALGLPLRDVTRAIVGFGPEMQAAAFENAESTVRLTQNQRWDRAHNFVLDAWLTGGAVGVLALLGLIAVCARRTFAAWRQASGQSRLLSRRSRARLSVTLLKSASHRDPVTLVVMCSIIGLVASLTPVRMQSTAKMAHWRPAVAAIAVVALVPILSLPAVTDALFGAAQRAARSGDSASALAVLERASGLVPWVEELPRAAGLLWLQRAAADGDGPAGAYAQANLQEAARRAPHDPLPSATVAAGLSHVGRLEPCRGGLSAGARSRRVPRAGLVALC